MNADVLSAEETQRLEALRRLVETNPCASLEAENTLAGDPAWSDRWLQIADVDTLAPPVCPPVVRVAMLRAPGRVFRYLAADATNQLRDARIMVVQLGTGDIALDDAAISSRAQVGAYDLVIQIGPQVPGAVRLAAGLDVPLLELGIPWPPSVVSTVKEALAGEAEVRPLLDVELDGTSLLTAGAVHVLEGSGQAHNHEDQASAMLASGLRIEPTSKGNLLELCSDTNAQRAAASAEIGGSGPVRLLVDGCEHSAARAVIRPHPVGLRLLGRECRR